MTDFMIIGAAGGAILALACLYLCCYYRCPSNKILAVFGGVGRDKAVNCYHGGGIFVWPFVQEARYLDLVPMSIHIPLRGALSFQNIRINVPSTFTVAISSAQGTMENAAVRLLDLNRKEIEAMASEIIFGQLRATVASLTIEQINQDREGFLEAIKHSIAPELKKIGLELINVNVTDIHDESGYIESIGKKAAATAVNQAKIDVAEQEKRGEIGRAEAEQEQRIKVAVYKAQAVEGENQAQANIAQYTADLAQKEAEAMQRSQIAQQQASAAVQQEYAHAEARRLEAEEVVPQEIERRRIEISAEAAAHRRKIEANAEAEAIRAVREAEAVGIEKILKAKADGYRYLVESCANNARDAATMLLVEKLDELVRLQAEAIKNIKIDKITVWDSGNEKNSSTANFMSNMVKSLPALHEVAAMAGLELPEYLGKAAPSAGEASEKKQGSAKKGAVRDKADDQVIEQQ